MHISDWVRALPQFGALARVSQTITQIEQWSFVAPEARPVLVAAHYLASPRRLLIVTSSAEKCLMWHARLNLCGVPEEQIRTLPSGLSALFEDAAPETVAISDRIGALRALVSGEPTVLIATPGPALERTLPLELLKSLFIEVRVGDQIDSGELRDSLERMGYEPAEPVRFPGQYSQRGGIFDLFATGMDDPIRIEFFGDEVESLRFFDPNSQRSKSKCDSLRLGPSRETLYPAGSDLRSLVAIVESALETESGALDEELGRKLTDLVSGDLNNLTHHRYFDRLDLYRPFIHPESECAIDLLGEDGLLILDEPFELDPLIERNEEDLSSALTEREKRGEILKVTVGDFMLPPERFGLDRPAIALTSVEGLPSWLRPNDTWEVNLQGLGSIRDNGVVLAKTLSDWRDEGMHLAIASSQPNRAKAMMDQVDLVLPLADPDEPHRKGFNLLEGNLAGGFWSEAEKFALLTDRELFGVGRLKLPQRKFSEGTPITSVLDLKDGDFVVHINFGIGIFRGLVTRTSAGIEKEFLYIEYAAPDKLYVPADQLDRIQKYLNPGEALPKLNRLTGGEWQKTVKKAREDAREFARDLIGLYAQRKAVQRVPFGPDSPWQAEIEATFPYVETPSQLQAIKDSKRDLSNDFPMDRLVVGDVGFGKTEVAIRAAFKVAQAGKQVAFLCPTTILSEQHYRNFADRMAAFPVRIDLLNRFRTTAERKQILAKIEEGEIDILMGTHAILSTQIKFKDLGMVIIDEEQKFGVKQKEALKKLRVEVDILTLSATPIPRTLSMALMDIRQMSLISDPPPGRLPVRTFVRPLSQEVIREAILRELSRGGQVFYVYNRIQGIFHIAEKLRHMFPNARIAVGHGQMAEAELEPVMVAFIKGEIDVLLSTTIVESGLDIPNANTLIVENADRMGLAQLYQLRGRVGRSDRQAYAYFFYQQGKDLTENATGRLEALQEFSHLGSGYNLAFRDLQIRGAGDLLGAKQHGAMANVGYELYTQLIAEEVAFLKAHADGEGKNREYRDALEGLEPLPSLDLPTNARIPDTYIEDQAQRLYYYKVMMGSRSAADLTNVEQEIADRYGKMPDEVRRAIWIIRLRFRCRDLGIEKIDGNGGRLSVTWRASYDLTPRFFVLMNRQYKDCCFARGTFVWPYTGGPLAACDQMLTTMEATLKELEAHRESLGALN